MRDAEGTGSNTGVSLLTDEVAIRRNSDGLQIAAEIRSGLRRYGVLVLISAVFAFATTASAADWQSTDDIAAVAEQFVKQRFGQMDGRVVPSAGHLDSRMQLTRCDVPLEPFLRNGTKVTSRTIIGVRCKGTSPWKVYIPVDIVVMQSVLIAKKTLPKGHIVTAADVTEEPRDVSRLNGGYLADIESLAGQKLKHQIMGGRIITPAMLAAEVLVRRGQSVTLVLSNDQLNISMAGKALADGTLNQRIRVENLNSQRVVEGLVRSPEYVEILVH